MSAARMAWWERWGKRAFDVGTASALGLAALPVAVLCALLVLALDGPPVLFRQVRIGRRGVPFRILKFRTMRAADGDLITRAGDPRVTRVGRWLRRTKLDELPQLWNVLRGDMSLVGPRPEVPAYVSAAQRSFRAVAALRPGITDWGSVVFHDEERVLARHAGEPEFYQRRLLPRKLALARLYHRHLSWRTDLAIIAATGCLVVGLRPLASALVGPALAARARGGL